MVAHTAPVWISLRLRVPRGYEDYWRLIREADAARGRFTITEITEQTNVARYPVEHYVQRLVRGGFARLVERNRRGHAFTLVKTPKTAPRLRADGSLIEGPTTQERLWRAMRGLKQFSTRELAYAATVTRAVPLKTAQRYINALAAAGYLTVRGEDNKPKLYRLKPGMNTGPRPPSILVCEAVWDRNQNRIVGETIEPREAMS